MSADLFAEYNNKTVAVHYENLSDGIYLFEKETGEAIAFLPPKAKINSAQVNQTPEDQEAFNRHTGRKKGIKSKAEKQLAELSAKAHQIDPNAMRT